MACTQVLAAAVTWNRLNSFALTSHQVHVLAPASYIQHMGACPPICNWGKWIKSKPNGLASSEHRHAIANCSHNGTDIAKSRVLAPLRPGVPERRAVRPVVLGSSLLVVNPAGIAHLL